MNSKNDDYGDGDVWIYEHTQSQNPEDPLSFALANNVCFESPYMKASETVYQETNWTFQRSDYHCNFQFVDLSTVIVPASAYFTFNESPTGVIYDDAITSGWSYWTNGGVTYNPTSTTHYSGTYGLGITYQNSWTQLSFVTSGFDTAQYQSLVFDIHGGSTGGQSIYAKFYDENYEEIEAVLITPYVEGGAVEANTWHNVKIPLSVLGATNRVVKGVQLESSSATTITVDNVALSTLGSSEKIYKDGLGTDWQPSTWPTGVESLNLLSTTSGKEGAFAMEVQYEYIWGALYLERLVPLYTSGKRALVFRIKGIANNDVGQIWVMWRDPLEQIGGTVPVADYMVYPPINGWQYDPNVWYTVVIPLDSLNAENVYIKELIFEVGNLTTIYLDEIYLVDGLEFPLPVAKYYDEVSQTYIDTNVSAYTARISSVFDHHMDLVWSSIHSEYRRANCADSVITAYTGEVGEYGYGRFAVTGSENSCEANVDLEGYKQESLDAFSINGQYNQPNAETFKYLYYDGHTGYDFPTGNGTPTYATADGIVSSIDGKVVVDHGNGYESHYLHLTSRTVALNDVVRAGVTQIGTTGSGHLHYTLMLYDERVDPYGWMIGNGHDPARPFAVNVRLWK